MHVLAIVLLLALATMIVARLVEQFVPPLTRYSTLTACGLGVLGAYLADFDAFAGWSIPVREAWIGTVLTGLFIGGLAHVWREAMEMLHGFARKSNDEAEVIEKSHLKAA